MLLKPFIPGKFPNQLLIPGKLKISRISNHNLPLRRTYQMDQKILSPVTVFWTISYHFYIYCSQVCMQACRHFFLSFYSLIGSIMPVHQAASTRPDDSIRVQWSDPALDDHTVQIQLPFGAHRICINNGFALPAPKPRNQPWKKCHKSSLQFTQPRNGIESLIAYQRRVETETQASIYRPSSAPGSIMVGFQSGFFFPERARLLKHVKLQMKINKNIIRRMSALRGNANCTIEHIYQAKSYTTIWTD